MNNFLQSALTEENPFISTSNVKKWLKKRNEAIKVNVSKIPFKKLDEWFLDKKLGLIKHKTNKFFTIEGINVKTNWGNVYEWEQPIINQPEVAILGIGRAESKQVFMGNKYENRIMLPLSLSYDHRVIDGAEGARFCVHLKESLGKDFAYKLAV